MNKKNINNIKNMSMVSVMVVLMFVLSTVSIGGDMGIMSHDPTITIQPNVANCAALPNHFTVNVANAGPDDIFEVRIYKSATGIVDGTFKCDDDVPSGWTLSDYAGGSTLPDYGYCEYKTNQFGESVIETGENLDFKFYAQMETSENCQSSFTISTLDNKIPVGDHKTKTVDVDIDCTLPDIFKSVGNPKIPGSGFDWWVTQNTLITLTAHDNTTTDVCNLGVDYCKWMVTVDGNVGSWNTITDGDLLSWSLNFVGDSNHYLEVECYDKAGNKAVLTEMDKVDDTPPKTTKDFIGPQKKDGYVEWIDGVTEVVLDAIDPDPTHYDCNIGVDKTWYLNLLSEDEMPCREPEQYCKPLEMEVKGCESWDCLGEGDKDFFTTGRADPSNWDLAIWNGNPEQVEEQDEYSWDNSGDPVPFTVSYDPNTGLVTYTVDDATLTWTYDASKAFEYLVIMAKGKDGGCDMSLTNVEVNGEAIGNIVSTGNYEGRQVYLSDAEQVNGFTVIGYASMVWGDGCKQQEIPAFHVFVMNTHDLLEDWTIYEDPFPKEEESCHVLYYFSVDELGNVEDVQVNCFFVDTTPPEMEKIVGDPKIEELDLEMNGDGKAAWVTSEYYSGDSSAKLVIPESPAVDDFAGVDSFFDVFVELDDVTSLSYYRKVTEIGNNAWIPLVILGIDADGDGEFEAQPLEWEASLGMGSVDPNLLGGDSFIQCEHPTGQVGSVDSGFVLVDAYNDFMCYTPSADGMSWVEYEPLSYYQANSVGRVEPTDKIAMVKVMLNIPAADGETVYVDYVEMNANIIIDEPVGFTWVTSGTNIDFTCTDPQPHPSENETLCFKVSYDEPDWHYITEDYCGKYSGTMKDDFCCVKAGPNDNFVFNFNENEDSFHDLEYYCIDAVEKQSDTYIQFYKVDDTIPKITKTVIGPQEGICPPGSGDDCYIKDSYSEEILIDGYSIPAVITIEDLGDSVRWTIDMDETASAFSGGHAAYGLIISNDKVHPAFQVHSNDGTCSVWAWGTHLYSAWDNTISGNYNGWNTGGAGCGDTNTPVNEEGISATGTRYINGGDDGTGNDPTPNPDAVFTITIPKAHLGSEEFYWAIQLMGQTSDTQYPDAWVKWSGDASTFATLKLPEAGTVIHIEVTDPEVNGCAVNEVECYYEIWFDSEIINGGEFNKETQIIFTEDSKHELYIYCEDALGNWVDDTEIFLVDSTPPETTKTYGEPQKFEGGYRWITSSTDITLDAVDEKVGVEGIYYMYERVSDEICEAHPASPSVTSDYKYPHTTGTYFFPSTNELNKNGQNTYRPGVIGPHVNLVSTGVGEVTLEFVNPESYMACFEYMTDGDTSQSTGPNYHPDVGTLYPYHCLTSETQVHTISADMFVEVRLVFGAERDWDFEWTKFNVIPDTSGWEYVGDDTVTFNIPDESCHVIKYFAVDLLGNVEELQKQFVMVDDTAPIGIKEIGDPKIPCIKEECQEFDYWVRDPTVAEPTLITLDCDDSVDGTAPHPVEQETLCYRVSFDDEEPDGYITDMYCAQFGGVMTGDTPEDWCCVYVGDDNPTENNYELYFMEDSVHDLEFYCKDHLGNTEETTDYEIFKVDSIPPTTTKTYVPEAYVHPDTSIEYIDTQHVIELSAEDGGDICHVDGVETYYRVSGSLADSFCNNCENWMTSLRPNMGEWIPYEGAFGIEDESCHVIEFYSEDALGNPEEIQWQCVFVDKTPPEIIKEYKEEDPYYTDGTSEWINKLTTITITVEDDGPHKSGLKETNYRYKKVDDDYCWGNLNCKDADASAIGWTTLSDPAYEEFHITEESCHLIEIYAEDNVGKYSTHKQCVFVDNQAPEPDKDVLEPRIKWHPTEEEITTEAYKYIAERCWNGQGDEIDCWKVTMDTPIILDCIDPGPHPVDDETTCFNVEVDGEDKTAEYCVTVQGDYNESGDGYCCGKNAPYEFYFKEETEHNLKYYCVDALGNQGDVDDEKFKVIGKLFGIQINKKWNLISFPFNPLDKDVEEVFEDTPSVKAVWTYDGETDHWYVYRPDGIGTNDLEEVETGWGYWVLANCEDPDEGVCDYLLIGGSLYNAGPTTPPNRELVEGWNLIGYYGPEDEDGYYGPEGNGDPAYCALYSIVKTNLVPLWSSLLTYWEPDNPDLWKEYGIILDNELDPGAGYWIHMKEEGNYAPSTACVFI